MPINEESFGDVFVKPKKELSAQQKAQKAILASAQKKENEFLAKKQRIEKAKADRLAKKLEAQFERTRPKLSEKNQPTKLDEAKADLAYLKEIDPRKFVTALRNNPKLFKQATLGSVDGLLEHGELNEIMKELNKRTLVTLLNERGEEITVDSEEEEEKRAEIEAKKIEIEEARERANEEARKKAEAYKSQLATGVPTDPF